MFQKIPLLGLREQIFCDVLNAEDDYKYYGDLF